MTLTLTLSAEQQAQIERRAALVGTDLTGFIMEAVQDKLDEPIDDSEEELSYEEWHKLFHDWISRRKPGNPNFDDSRESIYD